MSVRYGNEKKNQKKKFSIILSRCLNRIKKERNMIDNNLMNSNDTSRILGKVTVNTILRQKSKNNNKDLTFVS